MNEKRCCRISNWNSTSAVGRLSEIPDGILSHILSFLKTNEAIQTSVLSRRWGCHLWKHVTSIDLDSCPFRDDFAWRCFVDKVLSLRHQRKLDKVCLVDKDCTYNRLDIYHKVIQYAHSHDVQHLVIDLRDYSWVDFSSLFGSVVPCNLKTLELRDVDFDDGPACFRNLTTLKLVNCWLNPPDSDLSVNFPCLMNLDILECKSTGDEADQMYVTAPQVLNLRLSGSRWLDIEIDAPRLRFFRLEHAWPWDVLGLPSFSLPYVDRAEVLVDAKAHHKTFDSHLEKLYQGLLNAESVVLRCPTSKGTSKVFARVRNFFEQRLSSFTRLESLVCVSGNRPKVVEYRVERSSGVEPNFSYIA